MVNTDSALIALAQCRNHDAFGELMQKYQNRLFQSMSGMVGCRAEAEDVVQDTFIKAFLNLERFRGECNFYTWLFGIARNCVITRARRKRPVQLIGHHDRMHEPADVALSPPNRILLTEQSRLVTRALNELPDGMRTILILREWEQLDYAQIAEVLQIETGTVRSRLHRARQALRAQLERLDIGPSDRD